MPEKPPGDPNIRKVFGFPGLEAVMRVSLKYINVLREEQGMPELTWLQYLGEVTVIMEDINNGPT